MGKNREEDLLGLEDLDQESAEGLTALKFFLAEGVPSVLDSEDKVLENLYPLLDQAGLGACSCEQLMFLEKDKEKRAKVLEKLARIREYGKDVGGAEPLKSNAQKLLHKIAKQTTPLGGKHWSTVTESVAVGDLTLNQATPSMAGFRARQTKEDRRFSGSPMSTASSPSRTR